MPQLYQLSGPRLNLGPSANTNADYAKYLVKILILLKFARRVSNGSHTKCLHTIAWTPLFKTGVKVNFKQLPQRKIKKRGQKYGARAGLLKGRGAGTFPIQFFHGLSFLHLEITSPIAKLCFMHLKEIFFCHHNFVKKGHSKLSKNEPENIP